MPYTGFGLNHGNNKIVVKIHGPQDHVDVNTQEVRNFVHLWLGKGITNNLPEMCNGLAEDICDKFCNGSDKIWVQVDITTKFDVMYGASAEKVLT